LMLGWQDEDGDFLLPNSLEFRYDYPEWCAKKDILPEGSKYIISPTNFIFDRDYNWQYEAINWIHNIKLGEEKLYFVQIGRISCSIRTEEHAINVYRKIDKNAWKYYYSECSVADAPKEAIFEALFKFSQHLKNSESL
jgi:hypothetical protein